MVEPESIDCLADDVLLRFVERRLSADERPRVEAHLADCSPCRALIAEAARHYFDAPAEGGGADGDTASTWPRTGAEPVTRRVLRAGHRVGRYVVERVLGAGGMGVIYAADDPQLGRKVALKVLRPDVGGADELRWQERLQREARAMAKIAHPNVMVVFDTGVHDGDVFIAMELVEGNTLRSWMTEHAVSWPKVVSVFAAIGRGLGAAHRAGMVHRDFKPSNVLFDKDGRPRVSDFGLARSATAAAAVRASSREQPLPSQAETLLAESSVLAGTPAYMAPEQLAGGPVDARSDQYAFSLAFWEALFGERPSSVRGRVDAVRTTSRGGARVPATIREIVARGLRTDPAERFASMDELVDALEHAAGEAARRKSGRSLAIGALVATALVAAAYAAFAAGESDPSRATDPARAPPPSAARPEAPDERARPAPPIVAPPPVEPMPPRLEQAPRQAPRRARARRDRAEVAPAKLPLKPFEESGDPTR